MYTEAVVVQAETMMIGIQVMVVDVTMMMAMDQEGGDMTIGTQATNDEIGITVTVLLTERDMKILLVTAIQMSTAVGTAQLIVVTIELEGIVYQTEHVLVIVYFCSTQHEFTAATKPLTLCSVHHSMNNAASLYLIATLIFNQLSVIFLFY